VNPSIVERFAEVARTRAAAPALLWHGREWSFTDLACAMAAARDALLARGLPRGARVALLVRNSPQYVASYYGVLAAGAVAVPLNPQEHASVLGRQIAHCGAALLIGEPAHPEWSALRATAEQAGVRTIAITTPDDADFAATFARELGREEPGEGGSAGGGGTTLNPDDLACIIYTSGTTGKPKGVMLSHANLAANTAAIIEYLGVTSADRGLCVLPFHFSYGNSVLQSHLLAGAMLLLEDNFAFPHLTLQRMQDHAITGFAGVPSTFALLLGRCALGDYDLKALRYVTQAGGPMPRPLIERLAAQLPHVRLFIMYGQTEATARLTYLPPEKLSAKLGSVGIPVPGVEIVLRRDGVPVPAGENGEICARGPNIMQGYWNDPETTAQVLQDGWLRTGDLGHLDSDGFLYIDGRSAEMIKVGAFRVSPQEVEEAIAALTGVEEVGVTSIPDEMLGQAVKAVIVRHAGATLDDRAVKLHCRQRLAAYKVPKLVEFVAAMPRTSSGKIQRFKLA
jgi:long-chain acyl-CoA synthetase